MLTVVAGLSFFNLHAWPISINELLTNLHDDYLWVFKVTYNQCYSHI